jgi:hypothetical protein
MTVEYAPEEPEAERELETSEQGEERAKANRKVAIAVIVGLVLIVTGCVLVATLFVAFDRAARDAEYSQETVLIGPLEEHVLEIDLQEGRYDWSISSDSGSFDGYLILREHYPAYKSGEEFPQAAGVESVRFWTPFIQTGGGMFGLAIVNPGEQELTVRVHTTFRYNPPYSVFCLPPGGLCVSLGGLVLIVVAIVWRIRRK